MHLVNVLTFEKEVIRLFNFPPQSHPRILRAFDIQISVNSEITEILVSCNPEKKSCFEFIKSQCFRAVKDIRDHHLIKTTLMLLNENFWF